MDQSVPAGRARIRKKTVAELVFEPDQPGSSARVLVHSSLSELLQEAQMHRTDKDSKEKSQWQHPAESCLAHGTIRVGLQTWPLILVRQEVQVFLSTSDQTQKASSP
jgi:hypothetical protein